MQDIILEFARTILLDVRVKSHLIEAPYLWNDDYDCGLRRTILNLQEDSNYGESTFLKSFQKEMNEINEGHSIYSIRDEFNCEYLSLKIPNATQSCNLLIGPFTYEVLTVQRINELCAKSNIPANLTDFMQQFYASVPYISDERWLKSILRRIVDSIYDNASEVHTIRKHLRITQLYEQNYITDYPEPDKETITMLEKRYQEEERMMNFISIGDYESIEHIMNNGGLPKPAQRFPDSVRDMKNGLIILNTLCRKAAQSGRIHPVYLDTISKKYATRIENCNSLQQLNGLNKEMLRKYCMLVQKHSLKNYSQPVQNVINEISFHLNGDLGLESLAELVSLNKSYLSSLFKKETGETLTNYVNRKRIDHSIYLLNTTNHNIQDIAMLCGISDLNYFTKLFKKMKHMTPSEYRNMVHQVRE